jgi:hypothetical protein
LDCVLQLDEATLNVHVGDEQCVAPFGARHGIHANRLEGTIHIVDCALYVRLLAGSQLRAAGDCVAMLVVAVNPILQLFEPCLRLPGRSIALRNQGDDAGDFVSNPAAPPRSVPWAFPP